MTVDFSDPDVVRAIQRRREYNRKHGLPLDTPLPLEALPELEQKAVRRAEARDWKEEQRQVYTIFRAMGAEVWWLSQSRKTGQTPGLGDVYCIHPKHGISWWWETKHGSAAKRPLTGPQRHFELMCAAGNQLHGSGTRQDAEQWLIDKGLATREADGFLTPTKAPTPPTDEP